MDLAAEWLDRLRPGLDGYARLALENITREFPTLVSALMTQPGEFPHRPRDRTPVFYGSFDWHSCVEMHWVLVRLLKVAPGAVPAAEIRAALDGQFTPEGLSTEAGCAAMSGTGLLHYGWGWALTPARELATCAEWNERSLRLARRLGFRDAGLHTCLQDGQQVSYVVLIADPRPPG